jgi:hypothetical protein
VVQAMPLTDRQMLSQLSKNLLVPKTTLLGMLKQGHFRWHTSALKPFLTEETRVARVAYALEEIDGATVNGAAADGVVRFKNMYDCVDVNEKWFYQTRDGTKYILTKAEHEEVEQNEKGTPQNNQP